MKVLEWIGGKGWTEKEVKEIPSLQKWGKEWLEYIVKCVF